MGDIFVLLALIVKITVIGFFTFVVLQALKSVKRRKLRAEIAQVEAKMSTYRINLRNRIKRKAKRFRSTFAGNIMKGEPLDNALSQLTEIKFETNTDFQIYMEVCKRINNFIDIGKIDKHSDTAKAKMLEVDQCDFMSADFKNEINIVRLINDMVTVSKALSKLVERYNNLLFKNAKKEVQKPIHFESLIELQKVFKIKEIQDGLSAVPNEAKPAA